MVDSVPPDYLDVDSVPDYIVAAVPVFFISIFLELAYCRLVLDHRKQRSGFSPCPQSYRVNDTINSITLGLQETVLTMFTTFLKVGTYIYVYENYRLATLPKNAITWVLMFFLVEMGYYFFHRYSHEMNLFWSAHQVHHSSENYNLSTALRQSMFQHFFSWVFYMPVAWMGFAPTLYLVHAYINTLYQFWIHTETIPKFPRWFELFFNTPSHHRVHHGRNPYCIDRNYGGTLIIFDRMFGTFIEERSEGANEEQVRYGLVHEVETFNPMYLNVFVFWEMFKSVVQHRDLSLIVRSPGYNPVDGTIYPVPDVGKKEGSIRYDPKIPGRNQIYVIVQFGILLWMSTNLLNAENMLNWTEKFTLSVFIYLSTYATSAVLDGHRWGWFVEIARLGVMILLGSSVSRFMPWVLIPGYDHAEANTLYAAVSVAACLVLFLCAPKSASAKTKAH